MFSDDFIFWIFLALLGQFENFKNPYLDLEAMYQKSVSYLSSSLFK